MQAAASISRNITAPQSASSKIASVAQSLDVACGMTIDVRKTTLRSEYQGKTFYFCSEKCKRTFDTNPRLFIENVAAPDRGKSATARGGK